MVSGCFLIAVSSVPIIMDVPKVICKGRKPVDSSSMDALAEEDDDEDEGVTKLDDCQNKCISYLQNRSFKVLAADSRLL